jgi:transposase InsO family protein
MDNPTSRQLVEAALCMAYLNRGPEPGLLHHSDRTSQYASGDYQKVLKASDIVRSMRRKGDCWGKAAMESFFGTLETELVDHRSHETRAAAQSDIFEYMEVFYNLR